MASTNRINKSWEALFIFQSVVSKRRCFFERFSSTINNVDLGSNGNMDDVRASYEHSDDTTVVDIVLR